MLSESTERARIRARAEERSKEWRPRFFRNVLADRRVHGRFLTRSVLALVVFRFGAWAMTTPRWLRFVMMKLYGAMDRLSRIVTGLHMTCTVLVGDRLHLIHLEGPVSIHPDAVIGDRVGIMHNVTIGAAVDREGAPYIGNDVFIGCGAVLLGPIVVGENSRIAANSLVIESVPPNSIAIGVPARLLPRHDMLRVATPSAVPPVEPALRQP